MQSVTIHKAVAGSAEALAESDLDLANLFRAYYPRVYGYLRYRVDSAEDAEDLVSLVFERAYARREQFDPVKGTFSTWLFRIAHNTLVDHYRRRTSRSAWETGAELSANLVTPEPSPEAQLVQQEAIAQLRQSLERLDERDREIISLKFAGKLRNKEIGELMKLKEKTVSVVLLRAVRRLRQHMTGAAAS